MTKIDIVSGFLGAGKTTLIKKLLKESLADTKVVLIENEFGEIGIDGGFLKDAGIEIKEMNSGCICCSLVGDFGASLKEVLTTYKPERVLIEPSGVGKLSDVIRAVENVAADTEVKVNSAVAVVDASKCKMYIKNFGEFFCNQIAYAGTIILSRTGKMSQEKLEACIGMIREHNAEATIITTPWEQLDGNDILRTIEGDNKLESMIREMMEHADHDHEHGEHDHDHHDHDHEGHHHHDEHDHEHAHGEGCTCGCHDHHDHEEHDHHEHDHDHHDHHDHDHGHEEHDHHDHDHDHHHHHHADEIFTSWGKESPASYTQEEVAQILKQLEQEDVYGFVLRAKGMVPAGDGTWIYFDYVPEESDIRTGKPDVTGKICVIGSKLQEDKLAQLFR